MYLNLLPQIVNGWILLHGVDCQRAVLTSKRDSCPYSSATPKEVTLEMAYLHAWIFMSSSNISTKFTFSSKLSFTFSLAVSLIGPDNLYEYFVPLTVTHRFVGAAILLMVQLEEKCDFGDKLIPYLIMAPMMIPVKTSLHVLTCLIQVTICNTISLIENDQHDTGQWNRGQTRCQNTRRLYANK